jgi:hypothetical protein
VTTLADQIDNGPMPLTNLDVFSHTPLIHVFWSAPQLMFAHLCGALFLGTS